MSAVLPITPLKIERELKQQEGHKSNGKGVWGLPSQWGWGLGSVLQKIKVIFFRWK